MGKSLGDYNIEQSSSSDIKNIKWTQKNPVDTDKSKNKKKIQRNTFSSNIIQTHKTKKVKPSVGKVFKVEENIDTKTKNKKKKAGKKFQNSSVSNCKIKQGFRRPAR